jgi:hypothetical protein
MRSCYSTPPPYAPSLIHPEPVGRKGWLYLPDSLEFAMELFRKEDWWAIWIGLGLVAVAIALFANGSSIKWLAVAPQKWSHLAGRHAIESARTSNMRRCSCCGRCSGIGAARSASSCRDSCRRLVLYVATRCHLLPRAVGSIGALQSGAAAGGARAGPPDLEHRGRAPLARAGLRVEFYIKTGIVLLGASLPLTLIAWAGPVAIVQAAIVSLVTFGVIYFSAVRLGLGPAPGGDPGHGRRGLRRVGRHRHRRRRGRKEGTRVVAISLVVVWAIVMIFVLPLAARALHLSTGVAGAWIGTSEFADAAGLAAAQTYGGYAGNVPGIAGTPMPP